MFLRLWQLLGGWGGEGRTVGWYVGLSLGVLWCLLVVLSVAGVEGGVPWGRSGRVAVLFGRSPGGCVVFGVVGDWGV